MTVDVTVAATWRMARVEFNAPHSPTGAVVGYGEVLLQQATGTQPASLLARRPLTPVVQQEGPVIYGTMPGDNISRIMKDVLTDTVEVDGKTTSFAQVVQALQAFMEKWRIEDVDKPAMAMMPPPAVPLTPMPVPPNAGPPEEGPAPQDPAVPRPA